MNLPGVFKFKTAGKAIDNINVTPNWQWKGRYVAFCQHVTGTTRDTSGDTHRRMWGHSGGQFGFTHIRHAEGQQTKPVEDRRSKSIDFDNCVEIFFFLFSPMCCRGLWPDLAACQGQDVVGFLGVDATAAALWGELLLGARQQPQQHLKRTFRLRHRVLLLPHICIAWLGSSGQRSGGARRTAVLWDRRFRLALSRGVNTSKSNGSMKLSSHSQTSWNLDLQTGKF